MAEVGAFPSIPTNMSPDHLSHPLRRVRFGLVVPSSLQIKLLNCTNVRQRPPTTRTHYGNNSSSSLRHKFRLPRSATFLQILHANKHRSPRCAPKQRRITPTIRILFFHCWRRRSSSGGRFGSFGPTFATARWQISLLWGFTWCTSPYSLLRLAGLHNSNPTPRASRSPLKRKPPPHEPPHLLNACNPSRSLSFSHFSH